MHTEIPTKQQLAFMDWEVGVFFHFGIRTFHEGHTDWDGVPMDPAAFNPTALDAEQWIKTAKAGGATYAVLTAKHHDGFALWPSAYTAYSVKNTPWKGGQGDVVAEFIAACRKYGLKAGLYYSPAQFGSRAMQGKEYDDYFINQISELLTNYGKIDYLWFDGCGSEGHTYDEPRIIAAIRALQPDILIFNMWDPDTRWVGNEEGLAPPDARNTVNGAFLPYECDCKIRPHNWFYSENDADTLRTAENLMGLYDLSVGRGGNLLINIGPDRRGLLPEADAARFAAFGEAVRNRFADPINANIKQTGDAIVLSSDAAASPDTLVIMEDLINGEQIDAFRLFYEYPGGSVPLWEGAAVGHKRIITFPPVLLQDDRRLRLEITAHTGEYTLRSVTLY